MPAHFFDQEVNSKLIQRRTLSHFLDEMIRNRKRMISKVKLNYIFCNDAILHNINLQFLNHDDYTDIITFDLSEKPGSLNAELYISVERVAENAKLFNTSYEMELHRVIFHGALHLCGLGDKTAEEKIAMRQAEDTVIEQWFSRKQ